jgi:hypothetical protein
LDVDEFLADRSGEETVLPPASSSRRRSRRSRRVPNRLSDGSKVIVLDSEATDLDETPKKNQEDDPKAKSKKQKKKKQKKKKKKDQGQPKAPSSAAKRKSAKPSSQKKQKKAKKSPSGPEMPDGFEIREADDADVLELPGHPGWWIIPAFGTKGVEFFPGDRFCIQQVTTHDLYRFTIHNLCTICEQFVNNL